MAIAAPSRPMLLVLVRHSATLIRHSATHQAHRSRLPASWRAGSPAQVPHPAGSPAVPPRTTPACCDPHICSRAGASSSRSWLLVGLAGLALLACPRDAHNANAIEILLPPARATGAATHKPVQPHLLLAAGEPQAGHLSCQRPHCGEAVGALCSGNELLNGLGYGGRTWHARSGWRSNALAHSSWCPAQGSPLTSAPPCSWCPPHEWPALTKHAQGAMRTEQAEGAAEPTPPSPPLRQPLRSSNQVQPLTSHTHCAARVQQVEGVAQLAEQDRKRVV